ncbi:LysR family transcriptional regulator [Catenuloplanes indicus]|uniref:DNA-binding transcriptional LysR family regulator n=1 Tax=Catenuloplanes indicus TaxID=137267 RepID=A0AAE4AWD7_9ACTN|nr:LysR family transcriptional regulator [Catenuloplanes indicus]MDQ0364924.1 DNA-binding transcriptional LysR family regulator [Catenuloplanes indicus]
MELPQLEAFVTVAEVGSFTRAAARLSVSQPTVTSRIKTLEQQLETRLLERLPAGVRPTSAGVQLLPYAREIMSLTARARRAVRSDGEPHGRVHVGTVGALTTHRLLPVVEYLYLRYPKVQVSMHALGGDPLGEVRDGRLDCAFFVDTVQSREDVEVRVLCREPLLLVAGRGHFLLGPDTVTAAQLGRSTLIRCDRSASHQVDFERMLGWTDGAGDSARLIELDSIDAAKRGVANGMGMALLPEVAVAEELASGELHRVAWTSPFETFTQIAWRAEGLGNPALDVLVGAATQAISEQLGDDELLAA